MRISRMWENRNKQQELYEMGFIVVDHLGNTIEGSLPKERMDQFMDKLKEGLVYRLESFMVVGARTGYRTAEHDYRIRISQNTKVKEVVPEPENFPLYAYDAKSFDAIRPRIGSTLLLSDIVGVVTRVSDIIPSKTGDQPRRHIYIKNESNEPAVVTLWGEQAEKFDAEAIQQASLEENVFVLFVGMNVSLFSGMLGFKGTSLTRWHVDIPIPEIDDLRESLGDKRYIIDWENFNSAKGEAAETSLYALCKEEGDAIVGNKYKLKIVVTEVDDPNNWWFHSCKLCWKKMVQTGVSRRCPSCRSTDEQHRYKLKVSATDMEPNADNMPVTGHFTFLGESGTVLTGRDAALLAALTRGRPNFVPAAISATVGKKCTVIAEVDQETYDADPGVVFLTVSKAQLINDPAPAQASSTRSNLATANEAAMLADEHGSMQSQLPENSSSQATPPKDVMQGNNTDAEEDMDQASKDKKRKSTNGKRGPAKALFKGKQKP